MEMKDKLKSFLYQFLIIVFYFLIIYAPLLLFIKLTPNGSRLTNTFLVLSTYITALTSFIYFPQNYCP